MCEWLSLLELWLVVELWGLLDLRLRLLELRLRLSLLVSSKVLCSSLCYFRSKSWDIVVCLEGNGCGMRELLSLLELRLGLELIWLVSKASVKNRCLWLLVELLLVELQLVELLLVKLWLVKLIGLLLTLVSSCSCCCFLVSSCSCSCSLLLCRSQLWAHRQIVGV